MRRRQSLGRRFPQCGRRYPHADGGFRHGINPCDGGVNQLPSPFANRLVKPSGLADSHGAVRLCGWGRDMNKGAMRATLGLAAAALLWAQSASAAMSCWDEHETAAAKIRDLQSRLMVATLRCRAIGIDVLTAYNDFVRVNRSTLQEANGVIKAQ